MGRQTDRDTDKQTDREEPETGHRKKRNRDRETVIYRGKEMEIELRSKSRLVSSSTFGLFNYNLLLYTFSHLSKANYTFSSNIDHLFLSFTSLLFFFFFFFASFFCLHFVRLLTVIATL